MEIISKFGEISGLHVQPAKSKIIFLNTDVQRQEFCGIPVLEHGTTVRYLGYANPKHTKTISNSCTDIDKYGKPSHYIECCDATSNIIHGGSL
ncbi:RxLR effector candidate protein [Phytophthora palmivora]|uniref:RxLR effector candidate protein n=1 Tax=Phytophthora palmivora TaxID=4796 RepID=A0A2P4YUV7_9STRA|nr:RxLR effector candidate protein [Phytophthora palmivora]